MKPEEEKKLERLLDAVARRYEVQAPEELGRRVREALEGEKPSPRVRVWQPAFALLFVGLGAGLIYFRLEGPATSGTVVEELREAGGKEGNKAAAPAATPAPAEMAKADRSRAPAPGKKAASAPAEPVRDKREAQPAPAYAESPDDGDLPSTTAFDERGGDAYLANESGESVAPSRAPAPRSAEPLLPPSYAEHMESAARFLAAGREEGALTYWNAALERLGGDKTALPRPRDLELSLAWLSRGRKEPPLALLKSLRGRTPLTVSPAKLDSWIRALEKGDTQALEMEWRSRIAASERR